MKLQLNINQNFSFIAISLFIAGIIGCVPEPRDSTFKDQDPTVKGPINNQPKDPPISNIELGEGAGDTSMEGTWLLGWLNSSCIPKYGEQVGISYQLVKITQHGAALQEDHKVCQYELSKVSIAKPEIPKKARDTAIILTPNFGYVSGTAVGDSYISPTVITTFGYHADTQANPAKDKIPTAIEKNGPLAFDSDKDGQPGATFLLHLLGKTCNRYTAQRQVTQYIGTFEKPNMIKGKTFDNTEAVLFGSSGGIGCGEDATPRANDKYSEFAMARIDGRGGSTNPDIDGDGVITCDEVTSYFPKIMPVRPPNSANCP